MPTLRAQKPQDAPEGASEGQGSGEGSKRFYGEMFGRIRGAEGRTAPLEVSQANQPLLKAEAKKRQRKGGGDRKSEAAKSVMAKSPEPIRTMPQLFGS